MCAAPHTLRALPIWLGHLLLALAVCALGSAAIRVASLSAPRGLPRLVAPAPYGVAAAVAPARAARLGAGGGLPRGPFLAGGATPGGSFATSPPPPPPLRRPPLRTS